MSKTESQTERWLYRGRRELTDGTLGHVWCREGDEDRTLIFKKPLVNPSIIGAVYELTIVLDSEGCRSVKHPVNFVERTERPEWALSDSTDAARVRARQLAKKHQGDARDISSMTLRDVRDLLRRQVGENRRAMLAVILKELGI